MVLRKPSKSAYNTFKSYYSITLLSTLDKMLERVVATQLDYLAVTHNLLFKNYKDKLKNTSTEIALHYLQKRIFNT